MEISTNKLIFVQTVVCIVALGLTTLSKADAPSGAIFTTLEDGSEVNFNQFPSKEAVYLDGGPGPGAPQTAAGLDDGTYVFQVTDPSGKDLLSTDPAGCRQFTVLNGIITGVVSFDDCAHMTGSDIDHGATTVQMFPYNDTTNPGGVYKVWVVRIEDFLLGCEELGVSSADCLSGVDAGSRPGNMHGFIPANSKTDNFKVREVPIVEIDTRFIDSQTTQFVDGLGVTWIDTVGGSNRKWSVWDPSIHAFHEAHVEGVEKGLHKIKIDDGPGYTINRIILPNGKQIKGPGTVDVRIKSLDENLTVWIDVFVDFN